MGELNKTPKLLLQGSVVSYLLTLILPFLKIQSYLFGPTRSVFIWGTLPSFSIVLILASSILVGLGAYNSGLGKGVKRFAWTSMIPMFVVFILMFITFAYYLDPPSDVDFFVFADPSIGFFCPFMGMILAFSGGIGSVKRKNVNGILCNDCGFINNTRFCTHCGKLLI